MNGERRVDRPQYRAQAWVAAVSMAIIAAVVLLFAVQIVVLEVIVFDGLSGILENVGNFGTGPDPSPPDPFCEPDPVTGELPPGC